MNPFFLHPGRPKNTIFSLLVLAALILSLNGCDYARMTDDEAVNIYGTEMPAMPDRTIPTDGGIENLRGVNPETLANPLSMNSETVEQGQAAYGYFCLHCHGPSAEGNGTVGQSFAPLPANLKSDAVQKLSDGDLFIRISLGYKRCPPLAYTVAEKDRWAVIHYLHFLASAEGKKL